MFDHTGSVTAFSIPTLIAIAVACSAPPPATADVAAEEGLLGHWPLAVNTDDASDSGLATANHRVRLSAEIRDQGRRGALFNGHDSFLSVSADSAVRLGTGDFTVALWIHTEELLDDDLGDLVTLYDQQKRVGFNLTLRNNTGVTFCQPNSRQLQFGIDAGSTPQWTDEGRPGNAVFAFAMAVHAGQLFAGTSANGRDDVGHVYRYVSPGHWLDCGAPDRSNAISALAVYRGELYAASSRYRFGGSALSESENPHPGGGIYRYQNDAPWVEVGRLPDTEAIGGLVVYQGRLYASSLYQPAGFFRYEADGHWTALEVPDGKRVESLGVYNGYLWATSYDNGRVYRYDGDRWEDLGQLGENSQTYSFAINRGRLHVGTWPSGRVFRLAPDNTWIDTGRLGEELEVMGMLVHNGQLYAGTLPQAEVYRYDSDQSWTRTVQLDTTPDVKYRRAWTMAQYRGRLFCSTLPSGHVHSMTAGPCVSYDDELAPGWRHVAAVRKAGVLLLYVDGRQVAQSCSFDADAFDLITDAPLLIGAGAGDFFGGAMSDVRLYKRALSEQEIGRLATP